MQLAMVGPPGLEPGTYGLKVRSSAIELEAQLAARTCQRTGRPPLVQASRTGGGRSTLKEERRAYC